MTTNCKEKQGKKDKRIKELREVEHQMVRGNSLDYFTTYFMFSTNSCTFNTDVQPKDNTKKTKRMKQLRKVKHQLSEGKNPEHILHLASFLDLPIILFLITCSTQKRKGKAWSILSHGCCFVSYLGKQRGEWSPIERTDRGPLPPSFYLDRQIIIHMTKRHSPLCFSIL